MNFLFKVRSNYTLEAIKFNELSGRNVSILSTLYCISLAQITVLDAGVLTIKSRLARMEKQTLI